MQLVNKVAPAIRRDHAPARQRLRTDLATVVFHWVVAVLLVGSLLTGLRIASDSIDASWSRAVAPIALQGEVIVWHVWAAWALLASAAGYVTFLVLARLAPRVSLDASRIAALSSRDRRTRWQSINVLIYWFAFTLVAVAACSGTILYFGLASDFDAVVADIHRAAAWGLVAYVVAHVSAQCAMAGARGLLKIVTPRLAYGAAAGSSLIAVGVTAAALYTLDGATMRSLMIERVSTPPRLDGDVNDVAWRAVKPIAIHTSRGANLPGGAVTVFARAVHDGTHAYFLFEWPDSSRSQKHLPLRKTARGWELVQTDYDAQDEDFFYEDKFAVMLARTSRLAALETSHLGAQPLAERPGPAGGRGLHYTTDGSIVDVWHWKSVRTGPLGQIDDNYFGPPMNPPAKPGERYTGGYTQDPKTGGGFLQNWRVVDGRGVVPLWLPKSPDLLARLGVSDLDSEASDSGEWWLPKELVQPYTPELDARFPVGTILPSVVIEKPFEGDRGDVRAAAKWVRGWWRLEAMRKLDTKSPYDVPIVDGTYLWVAVFNHTQTRHSRHLHPVRLTLD